MNWTPWTTLGEGVLRDLSAAFAAGRLRCNSPVAALALVVGNQAAEIRQALDALERAGFNETTTGLLLEALAAGRKASPPGHSVPSLVISGPEAAGMPLADTEAVVQGLFEEAQTEVAVVGYAFHDGKRLFERLAGKLAHNPGFKVVFYLDIARRAGDTTLDSEILRRFAHDFRRRHWPWDPLPRIFHDPRALLQDPRQRASLHAKCIVVDRKTAFITSANFTPAAQQRNLEAGVVVRDPTLATRLADYLAALNQNGNLRELRWELSC